MTVELLSYIPEIFLIFVIMILVIYGVLTASKSTLGHIPDQPIDVNVISLLTIQTLLCSLLFIDFSSDSKPTILALTFLFLIATLYILSTLNLIQFDNVYNFEFLILVLCAILGMDLLIKADNLISMYLALELQSLAFYVLAAYRRTSLYGTESGLKYYVMGGFSSCILLLGIAFLYGLTGLTQYSDLTLYLQTGILDQTILTSAFILILIGFLFKLAAAPFHMWAPDVYQGAPLASTALFSIVPKIAIIFGLVRLLAIASNLNSTGELLAMIAMASIIVGTVQGLAQTNFKRLLSYSSINHVGFILIGLLAGIPFIGAGFFYVIVYILMTIAMFSILFSLKVSQRNNIVDKPYYLINNLKHLGFRQPLLAFSLAIILFSMAGVPPLIGFFSKFYVLYNAIQTNFYILAFVGILGSAIAAVYYIKLIQLMFFNAVTVKSDTFYIVNYEISFASALVISALLFILIFSFTKIELLLYLTTI